MASGAARSPQDKTALQRDIEATDGRIEPLVWELYKLTDKEIAIVGEGTGEG